MPLAKRLSGGGGSRRTARRPQHCGAAPRGVTSVDCTNASSAGDGLSPSDNDHRAASLHPNSNELNGEAATRRVLLTLPACNDTATLFAKAVRRVGGGCLGAHLVIRPQPRQRQPQGSLFARFSRATGRLGVPLRCLAVCGQQTPRTPSRRPRRALEVVSQSSLASSQRSRSLDERKEFEDLKFAQSGLTQTQRERVIRQKPQTR